MSGSARQADSNPAHYIARLRQRRRFSQRTFELRLERPPAFSFRPGQRIRLSYAGLERDYSLASGKNDSELALCIRRVGSGELSPLLAELDAGTELKLLGPLGYFTYRPGSRPSVFVATGTGIAPFASMARSSIRGFVLLHGVSQPSELYYRELLQGAAKLYLPCLSRSRVGADADFKPFLGRVTEFLAEKLPQRSYDFYLCGNQAMVRDATWIIDDRFPGSLVYTEVFF